MEGLPSFMGEGARIFEGLALPPNGDPLGRGNPVGGDVSSPGRLIPSAGSWARSWATVFRVGMRVSLKGCVMKSLAGMLGPCGFSFKTKVLPIVTKGVIGVKVKAF